MYGGIGIPILPQEGECMTVVNAIEIVVPFWDDLVQEKIKQYVFEHLKKHAISSECFLGLEIRQIRDTKTKVFVYFNDEAPAQAIVAKHSRTCAGRRVSVTQAQVKNVPVTMGDKGGSKKRRSNRTRSGKKSRDMAEQMGNMGLDELYPLQATYYYQPQHEVIYQQSEASFATGDSGFESHEVLSPPPGFSPQPQMQPPQQKEAYEQMDLEPTIVMPETCVFCIIGAPHPDQAQLGQLYDGEYLKTLTPEQYVAFMTVMAPPMGALPPPPQTEGAYYDVY